MNILMKIEKRLIENKSSVKTYNDYDRANNIAKKLSDEFNQINNENDDIDYIIALLPMTKKYVIIFNLSNWLNSNSGIYLGWFAVKGHFSI